MRGRGHRAGVAGDEGEASPKRRARDPSAREGDESSAREGRSGGAHGISLVPEPTADPEVDTQLEGLDVDAPRVGIVMGSKSDMEAMQAAARELEERNILHEVRVLSAHREP